MQATSAPQVMAPNVVGGPTTPGGVGDVARRAYLYVGSLSPQVNEMMIKEIFSVCGQVIHVKIIPDRNMQHGGFNYGFVEYADLRAAENAIASLHGRKILESEIKVDWATGGSGGGNNGAGNIGAQMGQYNMRDTTNGQYHVFVGDLSPEITDATLRQAFQSFTSLTEVRVMWDANSGKSRGYGFIAFRDKADAEQSIATMNGEWLGSRAIRVNWANQKNPSAGMGSMPTPMGANGPGMANMGLMGAPQQYAPTRSMAVAQALGGMGALGVGSGTSMPPTGGVASGTPLTYEQVVNGSSPSNTTVYVGNIPPFATQNDLVPLFSQYGFVREVRMQSERGFAFIMLDSHENAAHAIVNLAGHVACGRPIKCGWGKDRNESAMLGALRQGAQLNGYGNVAPQMFNIGPYAYPSAGAYGYPQSAPVDPTTLQQMQAAQAAQAAQVQAQAQSMQGLTAATNGNGASPMHQQQQMQQQQQINNGGMAMEYAQS